MNLNDLRAIKTEKAIVDAFLQLLSQKPFEEITVNEVCDLAVVRRATFYNHFADKYDLFSCSLKHIKASYEEQLTSMKDSNDAFSFLDTLQISLSYIEQNEKLFEGIVMSRYSPILIDLFSTQLSHELREYLKNEIICVGEGKHEFEITIQMLTGSLMQAAGWWFFHRKEVAKEEITAQARRFIQNAVQANQNTASNVREV